MLDWRHFFEGKRITIVGLGLLGRGVGDAKFLAENGAEVIVTDLKTEAELAGSVKTLLGFTNVTFHLGRHDLADFKDRDFILKGPTVPKNSPFIAEARKNNIPIKMSASWFAELAQIPIVGVTGTRGKSTTTQLLFEITKGARSKSSGQAGMEVLLGGNVRGVSTLALLSQVNADSLALMELDSWQLAGFGEAGISPTLAVFTTFYPDHLNYYPDIDAYLADKAQIFLHQKPEDTLVVGSGAAPLLKEKYGKKIVSRVVIAETSRFPKGWKLSIPGGHNTLNAMCAIEAARALGIEDETMRGIVEGFKGMPGRLELVHEANSVKIYNDTTATTPEATLAGLRALGAEKTILIAGGADKGLAMDELIAELPKCKKVLLLDGSGTEKIKSLLSNVLIYQNISDALSAALAEAKPGDSILFSPAFASFGMFTNEFDRGEKFNALVRAL